MVDRLARAGPYAFWAISGRTRAPQAELREAQLTKKINKVQEACRKKLEEVHNGYVQVSKATPLVLQGLTCRGLM